MPRWSAPLWVQRGSRERVPRGWENFLFAETWWLWWLQRRSRSHYFQFIREKRRKVIAECNLRATPKAPQWEITQKINTNWWLLLPIVPWANSCTCYVEFFVAFRSRLQCPCAKAQRPLLDVQQPAMNYILVKNFGENNWKVIQFLILVFLFSVASEISTLSFPTCQLPFGILLGRLMQAHKHLHTHARAHTLQSRPS